MYFSYLVILIRDELLVNCIKLNEVFINEIIFFVIKKYGFYIYIGMKNVGLYMYIRFDSIK